MVQLRVSLGFLKNDIEVKSGKFFVVRGMCAFQRLYSATKTSTTIHRLVRREEVNARV